MSKRVEYIAKTRSKKISQVFVDETLSKLPDIQLQPLAVHTQTDPAASPVYRAAALGHAALGYEDWQTDATFVSALSTAVCELLATADPTINHQYLQWIVNRYVAGEFQTEDVDRIRAELTTFGQYKPTLDVKDINRYTSRELYLLIQRLSAADEPLSKRQERSLLEAALVESGEAELYYVDPSIKVVIPRTQKASIHFGVGTRWCTAATRTTNLFDRYNQQGPLYIITTSTGDRYQWHFPSNSFMDVTDTRVEPITVVTTEPSLRIAFNDVAEKYGMVELMSAPTPGAVALALTKRKPLTSQQTMHLIQLVPMDAHTMELAEAAMLSSTAAAVNAISPVIQRLPEFVYMLVKYDPVRLLNIAPSYHTPAIARLIIHDYPHLIKQVRSDLITKENVMAAVALNPSLICRLPKSLVDPQLVSLAMARAVGPARELIHSRFKRLIRV